MPPNALIFSASEQIGPYRLMRHLGSGTFGEVWQAERDAGLNAKINVALKLQDSQRFPLEQIKREVQVWSLVSDHPNILPFMGAEEYRVRGVNYVGIASQYVAGGSLNDWLGRQPGRVAEWGTACRIVCGILDALAYMHDWRDPDTGQPKPIVHRDLKTANVLMNGDMPLLADLGLANIIEGTKDYRFTQHRSGTFSYMSPEAFDGRISPRMDIWAAGVTLYKLLSGRVPFYKRDSSALIKAIVMNPVPPLAVVVPDGVQRVLECALQKEENDRYQTAAAMRQDLATALAGYAVPDPEATIYDYEGQQRDLEKRLAEEAEKRRQAEAEAARLRAQFAAQQQTADEKQREAEKLRRAREQQERAAQAAEQERQRQQQAEARRQGEQVLQRQAAAAAQQKQEEEARRKPQPFVTPTPAKPSWPKVAGIGAAVLLSVSLLGYALSGSNPTSPIGGGSSAGDIRPTAMKAKDYTENLPNGIKLEMVAIPAGKFLMGSLDSEKGRDSDEGPQREVQIRAMYLGKYEVTQEQWQAVMGNNPSNFQNCPKCSVEQVSWDDAKEFIKKLNLLQNKYVYRLPSEAEWEYNARAGTKTAFAFGDSLSSSEANFNGNYPYGGAAEGEYRQKTIPVGSFSANAFGLYDMHGNVWEWCEDIYADNYKGLPTDGSPNVSVGDSSFRMLRGGSWNFDGSNLRSAVRGRIGPSARNYYNGVRVAASAR